MSENKEKPSPQSNLGAEDVSRKLDLIIRRLDALEELILEKPEYEGLAASLRLTKMGLGLYEQPLKMAKDVRTGEQVDSKLEPTHAEIQASLIFKVKETRVGENFNLNIKIVNTTEATVRLIKIENLVPEGFKFVKGPKFCRIEEHHLDMKGTLLPPLRTLEVKVLLKPLTKGAFALKPEIFYLDETGNFKSCELESVTLKVKELGISGWIRGPR